MSRDLGKQPATAPVDPDDDVDDLDDVLDQFATAPKAAPPKPTTAAPKSTTTTSTSQNAASGVPGAPEDPADLFGADFAAELQAGMEDLLAELGRSGPEPGEDPKEAEEMRKAWEKMLVAGMDEKGTGLFGVDGPPANPPSAPASNALGPSAAGPSTSTTAQAKTELEFQKTIRQAMEKMKGSEEQLKAGAADASNPLASLLADLNLDQLGLGQDGENGNVQELLEGMMAQLMSKEILYDPLKELNSKYPDFLKENESKLSAEDKEKYTNQATKVKEIVAVFEDPSYSEDNQELSLKVLNLMNEMQSYGSPPTEIMGELPPGMDFGSDGMPSMDGCAQQ